MALQLITPDNNMSALMEAPSTNPATGKMSASFHRPNSQFLTQHVTGALARIMAISKNAGIENILNNQQTTRWIFDSVKIADGSSGTTYSGGNIQFFQNISGKSTYLTNINQNTLSAGETLAVKYVFMALLITDLNDNPTSGVLPLSAGIFIDSATPVYGGSNLVNGQLSMNIQNQLIVKQTPYATAIAAFNPKSRWGTGSASIADSQTTGSQGAYQTLGPGQEFMELETQPVITPNQQFTGSFQIPNGQFTNLGGTSRVYLQQYWGGLGTISGVNGGI